MRDRLDAHGAGDLMSAPARTCTRPEVLSPTTRVVEVEGVDVAERQVVVDGRKIRAGTAEDAGRICTSPRSPQGISGERYRQYTNRLRGAVPPGPIMHVDASGEVAALRDADGNRLYDLDAVEVWHREQRPGQGRRAATLRLETLRETDNRRQVLTAAKAGRLRIVPELGHVTIGKTRAAPRVAQAVTELQGLEALGRPDPETGKVPITPAGRAVLARWG